MKFYTLCVLLLANDYKSQTWDPAYKRLKESIFNLVTFCLATEYIQECVQEYTKELCTTVMVN